MNINSHLEKRQLNKEKTFIGQSNMSHTLIHPIDQLKARQGRHSWLDLESKLNPWSLQSELAKMPHLGPVGRASGC